MNVSKLARITASLASEMEELELLAQGTPSEERMIEVRLSAENLVDDARRLARAAAALAFLAEKEAERLFYEENMRRAA